MKISIISEQTRHYTGGRYVCFMLATALSEMGHDVRIHVNTRNFPFVEDFADYAIPQVHTNLGSVSEDADLFIGLPVKGVIQACQLGRRWNRPVVAFILDVLPIMQRYHDQRTVNIHDHVWRGMVGMIQGTNNLHALVLAHHNVDDCGRWLGLDVRHNVHVCYPAVNHRALNKVSNGPRHHSLVWLSRLVPHKKFPHILDCAKMLGMSIDVITAKPDVRMVRHRGMEHLVRWHIQISDMEKFEILRRSAAMVNSSVFEGFGMFLIEALAAGTPAVVYDLPTYREVVGPFSDYVYFAKRDDREDLQKQLMRCLRDGKAGFEGDKRFTMNRMIRDLAITMQKIL